MDQEVNSSILGKIDVFFTLMFRGLFKWSWIVCLFLIGAAALYLQFIVIFGNDAGLADVSAVEFFFFVIIAGLIWRQWKYAKKNSQSIFTSMAKTLINAGIVNVFLLALSAVTIFAAYAEGESLDKFMSTFFTADYLDDLIAMAFWILIFYFSAPVEKNNEILDAETTLVDGLELNSAELDVAEIIRPELNSPELKSIEAKQAQNHEPAEAEATQGTEK
ncbi:MAG: hypothetical protein ACI978_002599 [Oleispira sp.]|jgi:hypothetical protein